MNTTKTAATQPKVKLWGPIIADLALQRFEDILEEGNSEHIMNILENPDRYSSSGPYFAANCFLRLPSRLQQGNKHITDEMLEASIVGFIESFNEIYWEEWLEWTSLVIGSGAGWRHSLYPEDQTRDTILKKYLKTLYCKVFETVLKHLDSPWLKSKNHQGMLGVYVGSFMKYSQWDECPADYGITKEVLPLCNYIYATYLPRLEIGRFSSRVAYLEWKLKGYELRFKEEGKVTIWNGEDLNGTTLDEVVERLQKEWEACKSELEEARKQENRQ